MAVVAALGVAACVLFLQGAAWANFTTTGAGDGAGTITTLSAPTGVAGSNSSGTVHVTWTGVVSPAGGSTGLGYWVRRTKSGTTSDACGTTQAAPLAAPTASCDDTGVAAGTYTYTVSSVFRSWSSPSSSSSNVTVTATAPVSVTSLAPATLGQGVSNATVTVTGTGFTTGSSLASSFTGSSGVTVNSTTYVSATSLTLNVTVSNSATVGNAYTFNLTNGDGGTASKSTALTVNARPGVTSTSPSSRPQGASGQTVTITGSGFATGAVASFSGTGITVNSTTFVSATSVTANVTITTGATVGARNVTVTNLDGGSNLGTGVFTVNARPGVTSTSPSSRPQGASAQTVTITGSGFATGAVASFSGTGITVNSTTFVSATSVTANVTITTGATVGARNVTVTNLDGGISTGTGVFTVNAVPTITSPTLGSPVNPGRNGTTTFTMTGTNFVSGLTVTGNGAASVQSFTWLTATTVSVRVTGSGSFGALGSFTVTNPDGGTVTSATGSFKNG